MVRGGDVDHDRSAKDGADVEKDADRISDLLLKAGLNQRGGAREFGIVDLRRRISDR